VTQELAEAVEWLVQGGSPWRSIRALARDFNVNRKTARAHVRRAERHKASQYPLEYLHRVSWDEALDFIVKRRRPNEILIADRSRARLDWRREKTATLRIWSMSRRLVASSSSFEEDIGYSRAVIDGDWVFVSGTTGFDYATMTISDDVVAQCRQAVRNIISALSQAEASIGDVVRVRYILPKREDFEPCWPVLKAHFGNVRPAATMIQAGLADARMKIEIEVTARRKSQ
jgi:enamine deaminase RidA (YjgF/YER057c/UK114 family)